MKKLLIAMFPVIFTTPVLASYINCNTFGSTQICRDSDGYTSTTHQIGNSYITNGSDGYRSTTHQIGDDLYQGHDNRGNSWSIFDDDSRRR